MYVLQIFPLKHGKVFFSSIFCITVIFHRRFSCAFILSWFNDRKISAVAFSQLNCLYRLAPNLPSSTENLTPAVIFHMCTCLSARVKDKKTMQCIVYATIFHQVLTTKLISLYRRFKSVRIFIKQHGIIFHRTIKKNDIFNHTQLSDGSFSNMK